MTKWEKLEEYLFERDLVGEEFNSAALAEDWEITGQEATGYIQCYLGAQTRPKSTTLFVLTRRDRTSAAMWHVGERTMDARRLGAQTAQDFKRRIERFTEPTLLRIAEKNPRALSAAKGVAKAIEGAVEMMVSMLDGDGSG